jgi:polysaccharide deacetylase 2 family uncharacterized protein YibQ
VSFFSKLLSKVIGKKKSDDFDDFDDDDDDDDFGVHDKVKTEATSESKADDGMEHGEGGVPAPSVVREEDDFDFDDEDDPFGEGNSKKSGGSKKKLIIIITTIVLLLAMGGCAYWYFFMGNEEAPAKQSDRTTASLALGGPQTGGLTPQQTPTAPAGKLSVGDTTQKLSVNAPPKLSASAAAVVSATVGGGMGGYDAQNKKQPLSTAAVGDVGINIPAVIPNAFDNFPAAQPAEPLSPATDDSLFESSSVGKLPIISEQGNEPWKAYARPFTGDPDTPVVGLVVTGLGMSMALTQAAIDLLPNDVTLSFSPYGTNISGWVTSARAQGHEVLLELPLETDSFPVDDPGPMSLLTSKGIEDNLKLLSLLMAQGQGYIGFVGTNGSEFTKDRKAMSPIMGELKSRGLFFMDPRSSDQSLGLELADQFQLPRAIADTTVKVDVSAEQIRAQLETIATIAGSKKVTTAIVPATPASIKTIIEWIEKLQGVRIAPMSSLAGLQKS